MSNKFDEMRAAIEEAEELMIAADNMASYIARLLCGRLRKVNDSALCRLKAELSEYTEVEDVMGVCEEAVEAFGTEEQLNMAQEECAELIAEINRYRRGRAGTLAVASEIADVEIMCHQLRLVFGHAVVDQQKHQKLQRLSQLLTKRVKVSG